MKIVPHNKFISQNNCRANECSVWIIFTALLSQPKSIYSELDKTTLHMFILINKAQSPKHTKCQHEYNSQSHSPISPRSNYAISPPLLAFPN